MTGSFDALSPDLVIEAVEAAYGIAPDGSIAPYSSYVNRVYGIRSDDALDTDGRDDARGVDFEYLVKFYRPGRWSREAIMEEHRFLLDCADAELPVVSPIANVDGGTLSEIEIEVEAEAEAGQENEGAAPPQSGIFEFALFPKRGGRSFDAESDSDWLRLGSLAGRLHAVGKLRPAPHRMRLGPETAAMNLESIEPLVHPEFRSEFSELCGEMLDRVADSVSTLPLQRIHGDLHRGNILDRQDEGLILLDFDDMAEGPAVQDLWLLLPGRTEECGRELSLLTAGYSEFAVLPGGSVAAIEALRFYRMLHFLVWRSRQRDDSWFKREYPEWGSRAFWIQELEDFREQARILAE